MAVLAQEFALIMLFSASAKALQKIQEDSRKLGQQIGFNFSFKPASRRSMAVPEHRYRLEVSGGDRPGIVHEISEVLAKHNVNVFSLESRLEHAAFSGTPLFLLLADLELPDSSTLSGLDRDLNQACDKLQLDLSLELA